MEWLNGLHVDSVPYLLQERARRFPSSIAYIFPERDQRYTWAEIWREVLPLARGMHRNGVRKGDRVAFLMTGRMELILSMYAAACLGAVLVPINAYSKKEELAGYLNESRPALMIIGAHGHQQHYPSMLRQLAEARDGRSEGGFIPSSVYVVADSDERLQGFRPYSELAAAGNLAGSDEWKEAIRHVASRDPLILLFTSGTLGVPKGVLRTTASFLIASAGKGESSSPLRKLMLGLNTRIMQAFKLLNLLPLYHMGGFATILTNLKSTNVPTVMLSRFHPIEALSAIEKERCKVLVGTPYMLQRMVAAPERAAFNLSSLLGAAFTSAAVTPSILQKVTSELRLQFFLVSYGSSEAGSVASGTCIRKEHLRGFLIPLLFRIVKHTNLLGGLIPYEAFMKESASLAGKVDPHVEIRIVDPATGEELPAGEQGEVWIRSHRVMRYANDRTERPAFTEDGWYRSGDLGWLNERKHLAIAGRIHRIISRGGEKISPIEIENIIMEHEEVEDALVIGVPDSLYGEEVCACIVPKSGSFLTSDRLKQELAPRLSAFKLPRTFIFLSQLPLSPTGKISIAEMKQLAEQEIHVARRHA
ncbi:long-chain fatty acid--CoA ligase [Paenibacillus nanensis]|uniref:Long-chain fatty acid--CoA ligase n=1 Tax=Paenibacillus nanensis TaxID=393251 RepID=A0A3A1UU89_9BACL|nr:class I adenylate-forming enzyme family protein [Paenibacillus nanensis]RIX49374.1 long-chain fatty acid--CoA ligase [Paenibacillus nanensis]